MKKSSFTMFAAALAFCLLASSAQAAQPEPKDQSAHQQWQNGEKSLDAKGGKNSNRNENGDEKNHGEDDGDNNNQHENNGQHGDNGNPQHGGGGDQKHDEKGYAGLLRAYENIKDTPAGPVLAAYLLEKYGIDVTKGAACPKPADGAPTDGTTTPPNDGTAPAADGTTPSGSGTTPATGTTPTGAGAPTSANSTMLKVKVTALAVNGTPTADAGTTPASGTPAADAGTTPASGTPTDAGTTPTDSGTAPASGNDCTLPVDTGKATDGAAGTANDALGTLSDELLAKGDTEKAADLQKEVVKQNVKDLNGYKKLGKIYEKMGKKGVRAFVNGEEPIFDVPPVIIGERTLVPFRAIAESLKAEVLWNEEENSVTVKKAGIEIKLVLGNAVAIVNGKEVVLDEPAQMIGERTMVPVRFIAEAFKAVVDWEPETETVVIYDPANPTDGTPPAPLAQ